MKLDPDLMSREERAAGKPLCLEYLVVRSRGNPQISPGVRLTVETDPSPEAIAQTVAVIDEVTDAIKARLREVGQHVEQDARALDQGRRA